MGGITAWPITRGNLERFWLGGAAHKRRRAGLWPGRAGEPKTCWTKAPAESFYGDCCRVPGIEQLRWLTGRLARAGAVSGVIWCSETAAGD